MLRKQDEVLLERLAVGNSVKLYDEGSCIVPSVEGKYVVTGLPNNITLNSLDEVKIFLMGIQYLDYLLTQILDK